ncbi:MAG: helix-turn-helix transcriptional regulator [Ignavibacteriae bacterium]|nr:XRE family transcriptional regulator [Ignavibacteriota bacterium]NOG97370.1 helix-turn-helix transcriptional regulator [Ignavibacteriota bacterium]
MKKNLSDSKVEIDDIFNAEPDVNQKAWGLVSDFYHIILTHMKNKGIKPAHLAKSLNKSRSYISQLFNKNPNVSIKKMVEIADAVGIDLKLYSDQVDDLNPTKESYYFVYENDNLENQRYEKFFVLKNKSQITVNYNCAFSFDIDAKSDYLGINSN